MGSAFGNRARLRLLKPVCSKVPSREMPPSKSFALKTMLPSAPASLMLKAAAFAEFGAIRAIAETARHVDIKRFISSLLLFCRKTSKFRASS